MQKERILNIGCIAFFGSCLFWLWLTWYSVQAEQVRQCGEDLQACRAAYCLENEVLRHNKNLTKKQFYAVDDAVECLKFLIDRSHKIL